MNRARSVLIVTTAFPPTAAVGTHRILKFCKFLPEFGWRPIVLTLSQALYPRDEGLVRQIPPSLPVRRTSCLRRFSPPTLTARSGGNSPAQTGASPNGILRRAKRAVRNVLNFPDRHNSWVPFAVAEGLRVVADEEIRAVLSTSPPVSCHLIARALSDLTRLPHVVDLRDLWTQNEKYVMSNRPRWLQSCERAIERYVLTRCSAVVATSDGFRQTVRSIAPDKDAATFATITNGIDRDDFAEIRQPRERNEKFTVFHPGSFYGQRDPTFFLRVLERWMSERPEARTTTRLLLTGDTRSLDLDRVPPGARDVLEIHGYWPHRRVLEQLCAADLLLLVLGFDPAGRGAIPAKLFEYVASNRPVLALVPEGDAAALLRRLEIGTVVTEPDENEVIRTLDRLYTKWKKGTGPPQSGFCVPEEIDRLRLTERLAGVLDRATGSGLDPAQRR